MNTPSTEVSPGLGAFVAFFVIALALWLLMRSMNGKLRGIAYRGEEEGAPRRRTQHEVAAQDEVVQDAPTQDAPPADDGDPASPTDDAAAPDKPQADRP